MKTNEHNIFAWLMLLAALSAVVACFVLRHLQDTGTMKLLQYGLLVYACVVVVVTLVALVKHLPAEIKRNAERTNRETEEDKRFYRKLERKYKNYDYIKDPKFNEHKGDDITGFIPMN